MKKSINKILVTNTLLILSVFLQINVRADIIIDYKIIAHEEQPLVDRSLVLPDRLVMSFNDTNVRIQKVGNQIFSSYDIYTLGERHYYNCVDFMGQKKAFRHDPEFYDITYVTDSTFNILNIPCRKAIGEKDGEKIEIYYTDMYGAKFHPNAAIDGIALMYTTDDKVFKKITYLATNIMISNIPKEMFSKKGYTLTGMTDLNINPGILDKKFPLLPLKDSAGEKVKFEIDSSRLTVINFWFRGCRPCIMEMPYLNKMVKLYENQPVNFIAISLDSPDFAFGFLEKNTFLYEHFSDGKVAARKLKIQTYPTHFIVDQHGYVVYESSGYDAHSVYNLSSKIENILFTRNMLLKKND